MDKFLIVFCLLLTQFLTAQSVSAIIDFDKVEVQPVFPGGNQELIKYIGSNIKLPEDDSFTGGVVKISFIIEANGVVSNVKIVNDLGFGIGEELTRILTTSPRWKAGLQDGKPVRVIFSLPVTLKI